MLSEYPTPHQNSQATDPTVALLRRAYEGEIVGAAMYEELIARRISDHGQALKLLYDIERITANALAPLIEQFGIEVSVDRATEEGHQLGISLTDKPWKSMWTEVIRLADDYLGDFSRLAEILTGPHAAVGRQLVEHEEALLAYAHREIADDPDALAPLHHYLNRYRSGLAGRPSTH